MQNLPAEILAHVLGFIDVDTEKQVLQNVKRTCHPVLSEAAAVPLFRKVKQYFFQRYQFNDGSLDT